MAKAERFVAISANDTKELRKELGLPITKNLRYMEHGKGDTYTSIGVADYMIVDIYQPSGTQSLKITLETGEEVCVLAPFFAHMQKTSFVSDMISGKE